MGLCLFYWSVFVLMFPFKVRKTNPNGRAEKELAWIIVCAFVWLHLAFCCFYSFMLNSRDDVLMLSILYFAFAKVIMLSAQVVGGYWFQGSALLAMQEWGWGSEKVGASLRMVDWEESFGTERSIFNIRCSTRVFWLTFSVSGATYIDLLFLLVFAVDNYTQFIAVCILLSMYPGKIEKLLI